MIKVGLTGVIGSGKSLVSSIFEALGVPVYHADIEAKKFLTSGQVIFSLLQHFGSSIVDPLGQVDQKSLASRVFSNSQDLQFLNNLIHPLVKMDFMRWLQDHKSSPYCIQEAAILFESGFDRFFDQVVVVSAEEETCISRVMQRDGVSREQVLARMRNQWNNARKIAGTGFVIQNDGNKPLLPQVLKLHDLFTRSQGDF